MFSNKSGSIKLITGPMFCGKTTEMINCISKLVYADKSSIIIKHKIDNRYDGDDISVTTHDNHKITEKDGNEYSASIRIVSTTRLGLINIYKDEIGIGIDEGQFFDDLEEYCTKWANMGKIIVISALNGDFKRNPFDNITKIIPMCDYIEKKSGICMICKNNLSSFSMRMNTDQTQIVIGNADIYKAVCRECYIIVI